MFFFFSQHEQNKITLLSYGLTCDCLALLLFNFRWKLSPGRFIHLTANKPEYTIVQVARGKN